MVSDETMLEQINKAFHDVAGNDSCHNSNLISHRVILDQIYQTLSDDGGVGSCIQNALTQDTKIGKMKIKVPECFPCIICDVICCLGPFSDSVVFVNGLCFCAEVRAEQSN